MEDIISSLIFEPLNLSLYAGDSHAVDDHRCVFLVLGTEVDSECTQATWTWRSAHRSSILYHGASLNSPVYYSDATARADKNEIIVFLEFNTS